NVASKIDTGDQDEGQDEPNSSDHDKGQARPNPVVQDEGHDESNPKATDASTRQNPKQMDEKFTTIAYPNVQENLKLPSEDSVIPEEPARSTGTLSSLQNLEKELSFTYQLFMEKQQEEEPGKTNAEAEPPPLPPPVGASGAPGTSRASGSSQFPLPPTLPSTGTSESAQQ
nr:hypothetical protein [Tanacetum cinerariifolium]